MTQNANDEDDLQAEVTRRLQRLRVLAALRQQTRRKVRAEFAARRAAGLRRRHQQKINREKEN
jgi:hypothetical protein